MRRIEDIKKILFNIVVPLLLGALFGYAARNDFSYLSELNRTIKLPGIVFIIAWSILYILMGIWQYYNELDDDKFKSNIYYVALFVNLLFTPVLFTFHQLVFAFVIVIVLFGLIFYLFYSSLKEKKRYSYLLIPYLIWLVLAFVLMLDLVINN